MKSQSVFEFREKTTIISGQYLIWESPRLSTVFPIEGQPAGSDRAICRTVNGLARVCYLGNQSPLTVAVGLFGEYAGIPALIQGQTLLDNTQPATFDFFRNGNGVCFDQFITYSNLVERVFIRFAIYTNAENTSVPLEISGVLVAADPTVS